MESAVPRPIRLILTAESFHPHERVILAFFAFFGLAALLRPMPLSAHLALLLLTPVLTTLCILESKASRPWTRVVREWLALSFILAAYWTLELFAYAHGTRFQESWIAWDRWLLYGAGLKWVLEYPGPLVAGFLETIYLLLYSLPPLSLGLLYLLRERRRRAFLFVLFTGTLTAYALLPVLPAESPRLAFPGQDLPAYGSAVRSLNLWLLDHLDISTSVFPSGHVAVAYSCAFGLLAAVPHRRRLVLAAFTVASLVFLATIYGRYHYAADGLASLLISCLAWRFVTWTMDAA